MIDPNHITPNIADAAERLVDTRGYSYDDAYRELGVPEVTQPLTMPSERDAARQQAHDYYAQEFGLSGGPLSPEQIQRNHLGVAATRAAMEAAKQKK